MIKPKYMCETVRLPAARKLIKVMSLHRSHGKVGYRSAPWESRDRRTLEIAGQLVLPIW